ncbi:MAG: hypothetical protein AB7E47_15425 [Desulfovibrionaceae bacterium]
MAHVIAMRDHIANKQRAMLERHAHALASPHISDTDIYARDYAKLEDIIFGVVKVREIMEAHLPFQEEWKHYLLEVLEAAYRSAGHGSAALHNAVDVLKDYIRRETYALNRKDLDAAALLLDLIEKTPAYRRATAAQ